MSRRVRCAQRRNPAHAEAESFVRDMALPSRAYKTIVTSGGSMVNGEGRCRIGNHTRARAGRLTQPGPSSLLKNVEKGVWNLAGRIKSLVFRTPEGSRHLFQQAARQNNNPSVQ